ncbi:MAG TPA: hypothetical protein EYH11_05405 [Sulfurimonas autotrophica]|nr:hypothetical protein [Sulfurimonas autotrophica]
MIIKYILFFTLTLSGLYGEVVVVTNTHSNIETLDKQSVRSIFLGKKQFLSNGQRITIVDQERDSEVFTPFYIIATGKRPSQLSKYRIKRIFTGEMKTPKEVSSSSELIDFLINHKNSIGYLKKSELTPELKVLYTLE